MDDVMIFASKEDVVRWDGWSTMAEKIRPPAKEYLSTPHWILAVGL
jgi:hypothetical protein